MFRIFQISAGVYIMENTIELLKWGKGDGKGNGRRGIFLQELFYWERGKKMKVLLGKNKKKW